MVKKIKAWFKKLTEKDFMKGAILFWITVVVIGFGSYIANVIKLVQMNEISVKFFLRVVGIFAAPFGALMGFL